MKNIIENLLNWTYPFFSKIFDKTTFRYAACGGANTVFDILLFFISYNFILHKQIVQLPFMEVSPHIAAFLMAFLISFPTGFFLMRYIVFQESALKGRVQLFRYFLTVSVSLFLNYVFLKIFVEKAHLYPTVAKIVTTFIVVGFSYFSQKRFSFKVQTDKQYS